MDNYIVSARKYRPSTFETVVGQTALTQTLRNAIRTNHLAHAYLFCGPRGVGKTTCARIFAKTINCLHPTADHDACNECESCVAFNQQRSFNIHELDAASNNSVEDIRSLIDQVRIPPQIGKYSVYIIDEVHMLSQGAFNALLKTLEEPPSYAIFILATTEKHKVIPTILSRCQVYDFSRITIADTIRHLQYVAQKEGIEASEEALNVVAQKADGGMRDALSIFDQLVSFCGKSITYERAIEVLNVLDTDYYFRMVDDALTGQTSDALLLLNEILQKGFDAGNFIVGLAQHLRDLLVSKDKATVQLLETSDAIRQHYSEQTSHCPAKWLFQALDVMNTCDINYRTARNKRLTVEIALVKLTQLNAPQDNAPTTAVPERKQQTSVPTKQPVQQQPASSQQPVASQQPVTRPANTSQQPTTQHATISHSLPSLHNIIPLDKLEALKKETSTPTATAQAHPETKRERPFSHDQLIDAWLGLKQHFAHEERLLAMLSSCTPQQHEGNIYRIMVANDIQKADFSRYYRQILTIMRDTLQNDLLDIQAEVEPYDKSKHAYTAAEKYHVLVKQNPHLEELKNRLNLQLE